jgi:protein N-terminal glutamine amidohydrolase
VNDPRSNYCYQAFYCEENVWQLASDARIVGDERAVIWISNALRACPLWEQRNAPSADECVIWDYHVIFATRTSGQRYIYDLDSSLSWPASFEEYFARTFPKTERIFETEYAPHFRVIAANDYVRTFSSDRYHMRDQRGNWRAPPPKWPCIQAQKGEMNLQQFIDMSAPFVGTTFDLYSISSLFT